MNRKKLQRKHGQMVAHRDHLDQQIRAADENIAAIDEERTLIAPAFDRLEELRDHDDQIPDRIPVTAGADIIDIAISIHYQNVLLDEFDEIMGHVPQAQRMKLYARMADGNRRQRGSLHTQ
jgi:hypothetical protein